MSCLERMLPFLRWMAQMLWDGLCWVGRKVQTCCRKTWQYIFEGLCWVGRKLKNCCGLCENGTEDQEPILGHEGTPKKIQVYMPITTSAECNEAVFKLWGNYTKKYRIGDLQDGLPLVVVCPVISRFEADIDYALDGLIWLRPSVVLLIHTGTESSLPSLPTATLLSHKEKYRNITFIDIAGRSKLHNCKMNRAAKKQLHSFLRD